MSAGAPPEARLPRIGHSAGGCGAWAAPSAFGCALGVAFSRGGGEELTAAVAAFTATASSPGSASRPIHRKWVCAAGCTRILAQEGASEETGRPPAKRPDPPLTSTGFAPSLVLHEVRDVHQTRHMAGRSLRVTSLAK